MRRPPNRPRPEPPAPAGLPTRDHLGEGGPRYRGRTRARPAVREPGLLLLDPLPARWIVVASTATRPRDRGCGTVLCNPRTMKIHPAGARAPIRENAASSLWPTKTSITSWLREVSVTTCTAQWPPTRFASHRCASCAPTSPLFARRFYAGRFRKSPRPFAISRSKQCAVSLWPHGRAMSGSWSTRSGDLSIPAPTGSLSTRACCPRRSRAGCRRQPGKFCPRWKPRHRAARRRTRAEALHGGPSPRHWQQVQNTSDAWFVAQRPRYEGGAPGPRQVSPIVRLGMDEHLTTFPSASQYEGLYKCQVTTPPAQSMSTISSVADRTRP